MPPSLGRSSKCLPSATLVLILIPTQVPPPLSHTSPIIRLHLLQRPPTLWLPLPRLVHIHPVFLNTLHLRYPASNVPVTPTPRQHPPYHIRLLRLPLDSRSPFSRPSPTNMGCLCKLLHPRLCVLHPWLVLPPSTSWSPAHLASDIFFHAFPPWASLPRKYLTTSSRRDTDQGGKTSS